MLGRPRLLFNLVWSNKDQRTVANHNRHKGSNQPIITSKQNETSAKAREKAGKARENACAQVKPSEAIQNQTNTIA